MPQLPSGRHVALISDIIFAAVRKGDFGTSMALTMHVRTPEEMASLIGISYYTPIEGEPGPGTAYLSGLMLADIGSEKCDWPDEDVDFFRQWLASDVVQQWLQKTFDEFTELKRTVKITLPENLRGILEDD